MQKDTKQCAISGKDTVFHSPPVQLQAAHSGSISASVCVAQIMDARGDTAAALKFWGKAAKLGHPEAQFRLGRVSTPKAAQRHIAV